MIPAHYFKSYREKLGFPNQAKAREFLSGKDISPGIDFHYIDQLNTRIEGIIHALNEVGSRSVLRG